MYQMYQLWKENCIKRINEGKSCIKCVNERKRVTSFILSHHKYKIEKGLKSNQIKSGIKLKVLMAKTISRLTLRLIRVVFLFEADHLESCLFSH